MSKKQYWIDDNLDAYNSLAFVHKNIKPRLTHVIEYSEYERVVKALNVAAHQLDGISLCLLAHGTNLDVHYLMGYYDRCAANARNALEGVEDET